MFALNEDLARVHASDLRWEARRASTAGRLVRAQRLDRRASELAVRARRANARVV
jgi:hypothetical protein